jgi:hypothetical protein
MKAYSNLDDVVVSHEEFITYSDISKEKLVLLNLKYIYNKATWRFK